MRQPVWRRARYALLSDLPGAEARALPVFNRQAVAFAVLAATAINCEIRETSIFSRKNYFYPDSPGRDIRYRRSISRLRSMGGLRFLRLMRRVLR